MFANGRGPRIAASGIVADIFGSKTDGRMVIG